MFPSGIPVFLIIPKNSLSSGLSTFRKSGIPYLLHAELGFHVAETVRQHSANQRSDGTKEQVGIHKKAANISHGPTAHVCSTQHTP